MANPAFWYAMGEGSSRHPQTWKTVKTKSSLEHVKTQILKEALMWRKEARWDGNHLKEVIHHNPIRLEFAAYAFMCLGMFGFSTYPVWGLPWWSFLVVAILGGFVFGLIFNRETKSFGIKVSADEGWTYIEFNVTAGAAWTVSMLGALERDHFIETKEASG